MRKVKLSMQMTINGYVAGLNGENDWMTWNPDEELLEFLNSHFDSSIPSPKLDLKNDF